MPAPAGTPGRWAVAEKSEPYCSAWGLDPSFHHDNLTALHQAGLEGLVLNDLFGVPGATIQLSLGAWASILAAVGFYE